MVDCCDAWTEAQQSGTDNEGYGRLLYETMGQWSIGSELPPIRFCPWCGVPKTGDVKPASDDANTVQVRIAASVDVDGNWEARGWSQQDEKRAFDFVDELQGREARYWVTAPLPIPIPQPKQVQEVEGSVTPESH